MFRSFVARAIRKEPEVCLTSATLMIGTGGYEMMKSWMRCQDDKWTLEAKQKKTDASYAQ